MALIRPRIDSSTSLVKGYIGHGNFDGFLIHARKGLLRLQGPVTDEKEERKVGPFFLYLCTQRGRDPYSRPSRHFFVIPYYFFVKLNLRISFCPDVFTVRRNQDFELYHS